MGTSEDACTLIKCEMIGSYEPDCPPHNTINGYGMCLKCKELLSDNLKSYYYDYSAILMASKQPFVELAHQYITEQSNKPQTEPPSPLLMTHQSIIAILIPRVYNSIAYFHFYKLLLILLTDVTVMYNGLISYIGFILLQ